MKDIWEMQGMDFDMADDGGFDAPGAETDGEEIFDSITTVADTDGDGVIDFSMTQVDLDGDGIPDQLFAAQAVDTDGDGVADSVILGEDLDGDTILETTEIYDADDLMQFGSGMDMPDDAGDEELFPGQAYEQFAADETDMSQVVGDPVSDEQCWEFQGENGPCAIYAQIMAYEGLTGVEVDPQEMIEVATEQGWYTGNGTPLEHMDKILNYLGADTEMSYGGSMDDLRECLENDGRIVVVVDGDEIWTGDNDTAFSPNSPNHAVEIIGIDYTGEEPMVVINDSGTPDGHAIMVPESQFVDAWEDSDCLYVTAYA